MGYATDDSFVRVDFFTASGKWYTRESVKWTGKWSGDMVLGGQFIYDAFAQSLRDHLTKSSKNFSNMDAICIHPYHEFAYPIQIKAGGWIKED